jgi:peroxidase
MQGCDASVIVASTANNTAEKDHPINLSLAGDGFDTVIRARAAVDAAPGCRGKVSCADILAMATRDAIALVRTPHALYIRCSYVTLQASEFMETEC